MGIPAISRTMIPKHGETILQAQARHAGPDASASLQRRFTGADCDVFEVDAADANGSSPLRRLVILYARKSGR